MSDEDTLLTAEDVAMKGQSEVMALREIRRHDPEFNPDEPVPPIDCAAARSLLPTDVPTAIVQYTLTQERGIALVLTASDVQACSG